MFDAKTDLWENNVYSPFEYKTGLEGKAEAPVIMEFNPTESASESASEGAVEREGVEEGVRVGAGLT